MRSFCVEISHNAQSKPLYIQVALPNLFREVSPEKVSFPEWGQDNESLV